jgi:hypothetical protein
LESPASFAMKDLGTPVTEVGSPAVLDVDYPGGGEDSVMDLSTETVQHGMEKKISFADILEQEHTMVANYNTHDHKYFKDKSGCNSNNSSFKLNGSYFRTSLNCPSSPGMMQTMGDLSNSSLLSEGSLRRNR